MSHIRQYLLVLNHFHHSHPVTAPYLAYVLFGIAAAKKLYGEVDNLRGVSHARYATVTVEVGADAYMVNAHDADGMLKVRYCIHDVCLSRCIEESRVERGVATPPHLASARSWSSVRLRGWSHRLRQLECEHTIGVALMSMAS